MSSLGTARSCHEQTCPLSPPSKSSNKTLIRLQVFFFLPLTLDRSIPVHCFPSDLARSLSSHNHVSATHAWWCKWTITIMAIHWPTLLLQSLPQPLYEHEASRRLFRPYTSPDHNVTKGRYITSNDPRGYMYVLSVHYPRHPLTSRQSCIRIPSPWSVDHDGHGRWVHPVDWNLERFVLTACGHLTKPLKDHTHPLALGHSKGNLSCVFSRSADLVCPFSRHCENGGIGARASRAHP